MSDKWQPIETAPRRSWCLVFLKSDPLKDNGFISVVRSAYISNYGRASKYCKAREREGISPTHWMPLPKPPNPPINNHT